MGAASLGKYLRRALKTAVLPHCAAS